MSCLYITHPGESLDFSLVGNIIWDCIIEDKYLIWNHIHEILLYVWSNECSSGDVCMNAKGCCKSRMGNWDRSHTLGPVALRSDSCDRRATRSGSYELWPTNYLVIFNVYLNTDLLIISHSVCEMTLTFIWPSRVPNTL